MALCGADRDGQIDPNFDTKADAGIRSKLGDNKVDTLFLYFKFTM